MVATSDTSYGSRAFARVARNERVLVGIRGRGPHAVVARLRSGALERAWYRRRLPSVLVALSGSPEGRMISEHLGIREGRRYRHRDAQGVLLLPASLADYLRGRHRQAVRTNVARARRSGLAVRCERHERWHPGSADFRIDYITPGPIERWYVHDASGVVVSEAVLSVDRHVALLHGLVATAPDARWLLHTAIVERLCGSCELLLVNGGAVYRESYGSHHFQRLLGYEIARLRVAEAAPDRDRAHHVPSKPPHRTSQPTPTASSAR